jgi:putative tryptophan/tyrosine transport system substrate-binding protein
MDRRTFIASGLALLAAPLAAEAQEYRAQPAGKVARIGVLSGTGPSFDNCTQALRRGLDVVGHVEGQTYHLEIGWAEGDVRAFPRLAADLLRRRVDVIAVTSLAIEAAREATTTVPLVMTSSSYPVERGLIASLARPGGNITGLATHTGELMAKRVQILKEATPGAARLAVLRLPGPINDLMVRDIEAAGRQLGLRLQVIEVRRAEDLPGAFQTAIGGGAQTAMTTQGPFFALNRVQIADLALKHRLPSLTGEPGAAEVGTLMFYGPPIWEGCQRAASYVDRILKGAKPGDLPVEQPTKIELVINLKTAKALGLRIPPLLLQRADQVIE